MSRNHPLDRDWLATVRVNPSAVNRRCDTLVRRRSVKGHRQAMWLLQALRSIDLTTLAGDDSVGYVERLCVKARQPLRNALLAALEREGLLQNEGRTTSARVVQVAAVCVYPRLVAPAVAALQGSAVRVAAVATGFPAGQITLENKLSEIEQAVRDGATEIDIVISRDAALRGDWQAVYDELSAFRKACGAAHMKTILATGELGRLQTIAKVSLVCMMAGADFIKTSTGKESRNATLPVSLVMIRMIREFHQRTQRVVGFKPAGGIKTAKQALQWLALIKEELGDTWLIPDCFRFGASSLVGDIERQLEHFVTGRYAAAHRQPMV